MCARQTDLSFPCGCRSVEDVAVKWNYKDVPRPPVPCTVTRGLVNTDRRDKVCRSRLLGEAEATRLVNELTDSTENWDDPHDPFNNTATGFLGVKRKSMLNNPLLLKEIGTTFRCCRKLPCNDFIYGSLPAHSPSAVLALHGWKGDKQCPIVEDKKTPPRFTNFLAMNRAAITAGICHHDDWRDFRNTHRIRYSRLDAREHERRPPPLALNPDATFGRPTSYVTTASEIMSGQEQKDWLRYVKTCSSNRQQQFNDKVNPWKDNHAYTLRMFKKPTGLKPEIPWHLPKFEQKAKPHLSTFRKMADETGAHNANNYEKVGRDGMFGQGIPTKACNRADALCCTKP